MNRYYDIFIRHFWLNFKKLHKLGYNFFLNIKQVHKWSKNGVNGTK
jgi:hypothetical protein